MSETTATQTEAARAKRAPGRPWSDGEIRQVLLAPADRDVLVRIARSLKRSMDAVDVVRRIGATPYQEQSPKQRDGKFWRQVSTVAADLGELPPARPPAQAPPLPPPPVIAVPEPHMTGELLVAAPAFVAEPDATPFVMPCTGEIEECAPVPIADQVTAPVTVPEELIAATRAPAPPVAWDAVLTALDSSTAEALATAALDAGRAPAPVPVPDLDPASDEALDAWIAQTDTPAPAPVEPAPAATPAAPITDAGSVDLALDIEPLGSGTLGLAPPEPDPFERAFAQVIAALPLPPPPPEDPGEPAIPAEIPSVAGMALIGLPEGDSLVDLDALEVGLETNPDLPLSVISRVEAPVPKSTVAEGSGPSTSVSASANANANVSANVPATTATAAAPVRLHREDLPTLELDLGLRRPDTPWVVARARRDASGHISVRRAGPIRLSNDQMNAIARRFKQVAFASGRDGIPVAVEPGDPEHFLAAAGDLPHDIMPLGAPRRVRLT